jgi:hypothetical protein
MVTAGDLRGRGGSKCWRPISPAGIWPIRRAPRSCSPGDLTIKTHISRMFAKIGSRDRAASIGYAHRRRTG